MAMNVLKETSAAPVLSESGFRKTIHCMYKKFKIRIQGIKGAAAAAPFVYEVSSHFPPTLQISFQTQLL